MKTDNVQCVCSISENSTNRERRILIIVLIINAGMFFAEFGAGLLSHSTALLADSLDMLADALVYAIGLFALGHPQHWRNRAALINGVLQLLLGLGIGIEVVFKVFTLTLPAYETMGILGVIALMANTLCFILLSRYREGDINLRATWICSRNDMLANIGVLIAAGLVAVLQMAWPDIVVGLIIAAVILHSAVKIINEARVNLKQ